MVYKVKHAAVTRSQVASHARQLGLTGTVEDACDRLQVSQGATTFEIDKETGSFDYSTEALRKQAKPIQRQLTDQEYRAKAERFLADTGLLPPAAEFRDVNRGNVVGVYEGGLWVERPYMIEVRFAHKTLDGIPFDQGVGPKVVVQFGEDGAVLGALSVWREIEPFRRYPLRSAAEAADDVRGGKAQLFNAARNDDGVVEAVSLSYMNEPLGYDQQYVVPQYMLKGRSGEGRRFVAISQAVAEQYLAVEPSLNRPVEAPQSEGKQ